MDKFISDFFEANQILGYNLTSPINFETNGIKTNVESIGKV